MFSKKISSIYFCFIFVFVMVSISGCGKVAKATGGGGGGSSGGIITYSITYNDNSADSGSTPNAKTNIAAGSTVTINSNLGSLSKTIGGMNADLIGWNTLANGSGTRYLPYEPITMPAQNLTLYAQWVTTNEADLSYSYSDATNGNVDCDWIAYRNGDVIYVGGKGTISKTNYSFSHWNTASNGSGTSYNPGDTFVLNTDTDLYAMWVTANNYYQVTYYANTATEGTAPSDTTIYFQGDNDTVTVKNQGTLLKKQDGITLTFLGWNTQANGSGTTYNVSATFTITQNTSLYAQWSSSVLRCTGPSGGLIFYDKGSYSAGWRYLEVAAVGAEVQKVWSSNGTAITGTSTAIGTGTPNSTIVAAWLTSDGQTDRAAQYCEALSYGGYSDWFLPSKSEADTMFAEIQLYSLGSFHSDYYWTSSEDSATGAWGRPFNPAITNPNSYIAIGKSNTCYVRPVRRF